MRVALGSIEVDADDRRLIGECMGRSGELATREEVRLFYRRIAPDHMTGERLEQLETSAEVDR